MKTNQYKCLFCDARLEVFPHEDYVFTAPCPHCLLEARLEGFDRARRAVSDVMTEARQKERLAEKAIRTGDRKDLRKYLEARK